MSFTVLSVLNIKRLTTHFNIPIDNWHSVPSKQDKFGQLVVFSKIKESRKPIHPSWRADSRPSLWPVDRRSQAPVPHTAIFFYFGPFHLREHYPSSAVIRILRHNAECCLHITCFQISSYNNKCKLWIQTVPILHPNYMVF